MVLVSKRTKYSSPRFSEFFLLPQSPGVTLHSFPNSVFFFIASKHVVVVAVVVVVVVVVPIWIIALLKHPTTK